MIIIMLVLLIIIKLSKKEINSFWISESLLSSGTTDSFKKLLGLADELTLVVENCKLTKV